MNERHIKQELIALRITTARVAQTLGVSTPDLQVQGKGYSALYFLALDNGVGWNILAERVLEKCVYLGVNLTPSSQQGEQQ